MIERGKKDALFIKLQEIKKLNCSLYTPRTVEELNVVYKEAVIIFNNIDSVQTEIDSIINLLEEKVKGLIFVADFSILYSVIEQVKTIDAKLYKTSTINVLKEKYDQAVDIYNDWNNSQKIIDNITTELINAKKELVLIGDNSSLETLIDEISQIIYMIYTKDTILALQDKYEEVVDVLYDELSQTEIDNYIDELNKLKESLVIREDKKELYDILIKIGSNDELRTESFAKIYNDAVNILINLDATNEEVLKEIENVNIANSSENTASASASNNGEINSNKFQTNVSNGNKVFIFEIAFFFAILATTIVCIKKLVRRKYEKIR